MDRALMGSSGAGFAPVSQNEVGDDSPPQQESNARATRSSFANHVQQMLRQGQVHHPIPQEPLNMPFSSPALSDTTLVSGDYLEVPIHDDPEVDLADYQEYGGYYKPKQQHRSLSPTGSTKAGMGIEVWSVTPPKPQLTVGYEGGFYEREENNVEPLSSISYFGSEGFIGRDEKRKYFRPLPLKRRFSAAIFFSIALFIGLGVIAMLLLPSGEQDEAFEPIQEEDGQLRARSRNSSTEDAPFMARHVDHIRRFTVEVRSPAETPIAGSPDGGDGGGAPDDGGAAPPQDTEPEATTTAQAPDPVPTTTDQEVPTTAAEPTEEQPTTTEVEPLPTTTEQEVPTKPTHDDPPPDPTTTEAQPTTTQQEIPTKPTHENPPPDRTTTEVEPTTTQVDVPTKPTHENPPPDSTTTEVEPTTTQEDVPTKPTHENPPPDPTTTTQDKPTTTEPEKPTKPTTTKEEPTSPQDTATLWPIEWPGDDPTAPGHTAPTTTTKPTTDPGHTKTQETTKDPDGGLPISLPTLIPPVTLPTLIPTPTTTHDDEPTYPGGKPPTATTTHDDEPTYPGGKPPTATTTHDDEPTYPGGKPPTPTTTHDDDHTYPTITIPTTISLPDDPIITLDDPSPNDPTITLDDPTPTTYPGGKPPPGQTTTRTTQENPSPTDDPDPSPTHTDTDDPSPKPTHTDDDPSPTTYPGGEPPPGQTTTTATQEDPTPTNDPDPSPTHTDNDDPPPTRTETGNDDPSPTGYPDETPPPAQTGTHNDPSPTTHDASPTHNLPRPPAATTATTHGDDADAGLPFTTITLTAPKTTNPPTIPGTNDYQVGQDGDDSPIKAEDGDDAVVPMTTRTWTDDQGRKHTTTELAYEARHTDTTTNSNGKPSTYTLGWWYESSVFSMANQLTLLSFQIGPDGKPTYHTGFIHPTLTSTLANGQETTLMETIVPSTTTLIDPLGGTATAISTIFVGFSSTQTSVKWVSPTSTPSSSSSTEQTARIGDPNPAAAFAALILPPLFALLLAVPVRVFDSFVRAYTPFHAMTPHWEGCGAAGSLCRVTGGAGGGVWGLLGRVGAGMKRGKGRGGEANKGLLAWVSGGLVWGAAAVVILSGEAVRLVVVDADTGMRKRDEDEYLTKVGTYRPVLAAVLAILGVMAFLAIWAFWLLRDWDTGCRGRSAWSLFRMAELGSNHDIRLLMRRVRHLGMRSPARGGVFGWGGKGIGISNKDAARVLTEEGARRFILSDWKDNGTYKYGVLINHNEPAEEAMRGEKNQRSKSVRFKDADGDDMSNNGRGRGKKGRDGKKPQHMMPFFVLTHLGRLMFLALLLGTLISILIYDFAGGDRTAMGRSGGTKFMFMAVGVLISFIWGYFYHAVSFMSPYKLRHSPGFSREALHMTPHLHPAGGFMAAISYGWSGDPFLGFVSAAALLAEVPLPLLLANVPYTGISVSAPVTTAHLACTWAAVCLLCAHVFVVAASFLVEWPRLPIDPSTVAGAMCCAEKLVLSSTPRLGGGRGVYRGGAATLGRSSTPSLL